VKLRPGQEPNKLIVEMSNKPFPVIIREVNGHQVELSLDGEEYSFRRPYPSLDQVQQQAPTHPVAGNGTLTAPMPGRVIAIMVREGEAVHPDEPLVIIESMKMETAIRSDREGVVEQLLVSEKDSVKRGQALLKFSG
jgi:biotin carboxyl carrier protein